MLELDRALVRVNYKMAVCSVQVPLFLMNLLERGKKMKRRGRRQKTVYLNGIEEQRKREIKVKEQGWGKTKSG